MSFFICNVLNVNSLKCVSINKQDNKIKPKILNINGNEPLFYLYNIPVISMVHTQNRVFLMLLKA